MFGVVANTSYAIANVLVKVLFNRNPTISEYEVIYWKSITMIIYNYFYIRHFGHTVVSVPPKYRNIIVFRALIGFGGVQGYWGAIKYMPLNIGSCICMATPIFTAILACIFLGERITKYDVISMVCAFAGVILINNPFE